MAENAARAVTITKIEEALASFAALFTEVPKGQKLPKGQKRPFGDKDTKGFNKQFVLLLDKLLDVHVVAYLMTPPSVPDEKHGNLVMRVCDLLAQMTDKKWFTPLMKTEKAEQVLHFWDDLAHSAAASDVLINEFGIEEKTTARMDYLIKDFERRLRDYVIAHRSNILKGQPLPGRKIPVEPLDMGYHTPPAGEGSQPMDRIPDSPPKTPPFRQPTPQDVLAADLNFEEFLRLNRPSSSSSSSGFASSSITTTSTSTTVTSTSKKKTARTPSPPRPGKINKKLNPFGFTRESSPAQQDRVVAKMTAMGFEEHYDPEDEKSGSDEEVKELLDQAERVLNDEKEEPGIPEVFVLGEAPPPEEEKEPGPPLPFILPERLHEGEPPHEDAKHEENKHEEKKEEEKKDLAAEVDPAQETLPCTFPSEVVRVPIGGMRINEPQTLQIPDPCDPWKEPFRYDPQLEPDLSKIRTPKEFEPKEGESNHTRRLRYICHELHRFFDDVTNPNFFFLEGDDMNHRLAEETFDAMVSERQSLSLFCPMWNMRGWRRLLCLANHDDKKKAQLDRLFHHVCVWYLNSFSFALHLTMIELDKKFGNTVPGCLMACLVHDCWFIDIIQRTAKESTGDLHVLPTEMLWKRIEAYFEDRAPCPDIRVISRGWGLSLDVIKPIRKAVMLRILILTERLFMYNLNVELKVHGETNFRYLCCIVFYKSKLLSFGRLKLWLKFEHGKAYKNSAMSMERPFNFPEMTTQTENFFEAPSSRDEYEQIFKKWMKALAAFDQDHTVDETMARIRLLRIRPIQEDKEGFALMAPALKMAGLYSGAGAATNWYESGELTENKTHNALTAYMWNELFTPHAPKFMTAADWMEIALRPSWLEAQFNFQPEGTPRDQLREILREASDEDEDEKMRDRAESENVLSQLHEPGEDDGKHESGPDNPGELEIKWENRVEDFLDNFQRDLHDPEEFGFREEQETEARDPHHYEAPGKSRLRQEYEEGAPLYAQRQAYKRKREHREQIANERARRIRIVKDIRRHPAKYAID
jgi:hypothetical protein